MNIKCPYCGCCYELSPNILKDPIGNEKLGYGWWLRCCRCHKKWWIKNEFVEENFKTPLKANKKEKIEKLNTLLKHKQNKEKTPFSYKKLFKYFALVLLGIAVFSAYSFRNEFLSYIQMKAQILKSNIKSKLELAEVKYSINENNEISVTGNIVNTDEKNILRVNGIKFIVFDGETKVFSWNSELENSVILPTQQIPFSSSKPLPSNIENINVEVSLY